VEPEGQPQIGRNEVSDLIKETEIHVTLSEGETGYFEMIQEFYESAESLTSQMGEMTQYTAEIGEQLAAHTRSANELMQKYGNKPQIGGSRDAQKFLSEAKEVVDSAAKDLDSFTTRMTPNVVTLRANLGSMLGRFRDAYFFAREELATPEEQKREAIEALGKFVETMAGVVSNITGFQESITKLPALITKFKRARKRATSILGELVAEIKLAIDQGHEILNQCESPQSRSGVINTSNLEI
jgi:hypothetical protein